MFQTKGNIIDTICREPYRLFFPLGVLAGSWGVGQWLLLALGLVPSVQGFYHSSFQSLVYMNCFIVGFLSTALPRFTNTYPAKKMEIGSFLFLFLGIVVFLSLGQWVVAEIIFIAWLLALVFFVVVRISRRPRSSNVGKPPLEIIWVPFGILQGMMGAVLLILGQMKMVDVWILKVGKPMMEQGFLLSVVVGVGGFLIPRLLGTYNSHEQACERPVLNMGRRPSVGIYGFCAFLMFLSFWLEGAGFLNIGYLLRAVIITYVYSSTGILKWIKDADLYARLAWVSAWMVALGYWGAAIVPTHAVIMLHITFIGGFSLMTFAIATMVILSHSGKGHILKTNLWILWVIAAGILVAFLHRSLAEAFPDYYFKILGIAAAVWIFSALVWLGYMVPSLFHVPREDEFAKLHEQAAKLKK